jgi:hypothetical protein
MVRTFWIKSQTQMVVFLKVRFLVLLVTVQFSIKPFFPGIRADPLSPIDFYPGPSSHIYWTCADSRQLTAPSWLSVG